MPKDLSMWKLKARKMSNTIPPIHDDYWWNISRSERRSGNEWRSYSYFNFPPDASPPKKPKRGDWIIVDKVDPKKPVAHYYGLAGDIITQRMRHFPVGKEFVIKPARVESLSPLKAHDPAYIRKYLMEDLETRGFDLSDTPKKEEPWKVFDTCEKALTHLHKTRSSSIDVS